MYTQNPAAFTGIGAGTLTSMMPQMLEIAMARREAAMYGTTPTGGAGSTPAEDTYAAAEEGSSAPSSAQSAMRGSGTLLSQVPAALERALGRREAKESTAKVEGTKSGSGTGGARPRVQDVETAPSTRRAPKDLRSHLFNESRSTIDYRGSGLTVVDGVELEARDMMEGDALMSQIAFTMGSAVHTGLNLSDEHTATTLMRSVTFTVASMLYGPEKLDEFFTPNGQLKPNSPEILREMEESIADNYAIIRDFVQGKSSKIS